MSLTEITQPLGCTEPYTLTFSDADGDPYPFAGTEVLHADLWAGGDLAVLASPSVAWVAPVDPATTTSTAVLTVSAANTASLTTGKYRLRVTIPATSQLLWEGVITLSDAPGTATAPKTYCTYQDMVNWWPDIDQFESYHSGTQYVFQRAQARTWLEEIIQRHSPRVRYVAFATPLNGPNAWFMYGEQGTDPVLQGYLDDDKLMVTSRVVEIQAKRALGMALSSATGTTDKDSQYHRRGREFLAEADALLCGYVAEVDEDGDGYSELRIPMGVTSSR